MPEPKDVRAGTPAKDRDLHNLQQAYSSLARKARLYERIHPLFLNPKRLEANLDAVMKALLLDLDAEAGSIILIDPDAGEFFFAAAEGPVSDEIKKIRFPRTRGIAGAAAEGRRTIAVSDVSQDPRFYREITDQMGYEVRSLLAVPILLRDEPIGVLEVINKREGNQFLSHEIDLVEKVAGLTAILILLGEHFSPEF
jgi:GAF domain-containing protein